MRKSKRLRVLIKRAKRGEPRALYTLGRLYEDGRDIVQDARLARELIMLSADAGYKPAVDWVQDYFFDDNPLIQAEA